MAEAAKILLIDDDKLVLQVVGGALRRAGYQVTALSDPLEGLATVQDPTIDLVVTDLQMPGLSGLELIKAFKAAQPTIEVMVITGHGSIDLAVQAVKLGAYDMLAKPFERLDDFVLRVEKAIERRLLKRRAEAAESALDARNQFEGIIGQSAQMRAVFKLVESVSASSATVLIQGESGTGKELVARAIHDRSPRKKKPFVAVNCSALTDTLVESELFGHEKGAFTGAIAAKRGLFEAADGGTLFLDEIGDVSLATQVKLLRVLQEGEVKRVGAVEAQKVDVRLITATHVDLAKARTEGTFREDLYYRLNVITVNLPALRERPTDVPLLVQHFVTRYAGKMNKAVPAVTAAAMERLMRCAWVGNVRELENVVERALVLDLDASIGVDDLPAHLDAGSPRAPLGDPVDYELSSLPFSQAKALTVSAFERRYLSAVMERNGQKLSLAALAAGMDRSNFRRLLKENGLRGSKNDEPGPE